jgi:hypothetical protein
MKILAQTKVIISLLAMIAELSLLAQVDLYTISSLPFNTKGNDEFAAVPYKEGLVFCSDKTPSVFISRFDEEHHPLLDLYYVPKKPSQKWGPPVLFSKELNSKYQEGPISFSPDKKTIYFTRNTSDIDGIFIAEMGSGDWEKVIPFQYNLANSKTAHPSISPDGKRMFFASNRSGGQGSFDIYMCNRIGNRWGSPKNLGPEINTKDKELYPFYNNGKLYFASNRKNGYGGLDIYYSLEVNGKWIKPILLPPPMNTKEDDFAYYSDSTDRHGYFSTDRYDQSNDYKTNDIIEFTMNFPAFPDSLCKPLEKNSYTYEFIEQSAVNTDTTTFVYEWNFGDGNKIRGRLLDVEHTFEKPGDYQVQLNVIDTLTDSIYLNQASNLFPVRNTEQPFITGPDSTTINEDVSFNSDKTYLPDKQINEFYWDFGDGRIATGKKVTHKFEDQGTYKVKLGVFVLDENKQPAYFYRYKIIVVRKKPLN